ncbi:MAG: molecular chaperone DnaJ [Candidatus Omnitrophota bacterium]|nr:molecular chaperone DnaJ [Candidatus Omnitrophota bacterium]MBU2528099.1 molecular chaperone DnaJ [bacterium]MBU3929699.1 molecular chaperone DnaJ [bacterium]MBU4123696.1 molecular chaperone DnaJ [bacterium]
MTEKRDYYDILGVARDAAAADIKSAYRKLALKHHPDRVGESEKKSAEEKFKKISEAYAVLSDPQKRQQYDRFGHEGIDSRYSQEDIFKNADFGDFADILRSAFGGGTGGFSFGGGRGRGGAQAGQDIETRMVITLEEAFTGTEKEITYSRAKKCDACGGSGAKPGTKASTCPLCRGRGVVTEGSFIFSMQRPCPECGGRGQIIKHKCPSCAGHGLVKKKENLKVKVPKGVVSGTSLRVKEKGYESPQGIAGNLYVLIEVLPHKDFERRESNLYTKIAIPFPVAVLGGTIKAQAINKTVQMKIPPHCPDGQVFRLRGYGMPHLNAAYSGDLFVTVVIHVPKKVPAKAKKLLEDYMKIMEEEQTPFYKNLFE